MGTLPPPSNLISCSNLGSGGRGRRLRRGLSIHPRHVDTGCGRKDPGSHGCCRCSVRHRLRDVGGGRARPRIDTVTHTEHPGARGAPRTALARQDESIRVDGDASGLRQLLHTLCRAHTYRQHQQIDHLLTLRREQTQILAARQFMNRGRPPAPVSHPGQAGHPLEIPLVTLARRSHVHGKHRQLRVRDNLLTQPHLLRRDHTAGGGAVGTSQGLTTRANTVDEGDPLRHPTIRGAQDPPLGGARAVEHALQLKAGDHVRAPTPAVFDRLGSIERGEPRRQHDSPHVYLLHLARSTQVDRILGAGSHARLTAGVDAYAGVPVDGVGMGHSLRRRCVDRVRRRIVPQQIPGWVNTVTRYILVEIPAAAMQFIRSKGIWRSPSEVFTIA